MFLAILKPLDFTEAVMQINFYISCNLLHLNILLAFLCLFLARISFPFTSQRPCGWGNMTVFLFFLCLFGWGPFILIQHPTSFGGNRPCECGNKTFWLDTWPRDWSVTWLHGWGPLILSHQLAKYGVHRPCEKGDIKFFSCHVTTILKSHVTWQVSGTGWGLLILNHHTAKFGVHKPNETGNNGVFSITFNSNSNPNVYKWPCKRIYV